MAPAKEVVTTTVDSPIGKLTLTGCDGFLTGLHMDGQRHFPTDGDSWAPDGSAFTEVVEQLDSYFAGTLTRFDLPIRLKGTAFQLRVWAVLQTVPYGHTVSYGELAGLCGNQRASRAVGLANGRNPIAVIVPCHRVIAADGTIGGYGGGLDRKRWLLDHETARILG